MTTDHCNGPDCWVCNGLTDELIDAAIADNTQGGNRNGHV